MSAVVKLGSPSRTSSYLGIAGAGQEFVQVTKDLMGVMLRAGTVEIVGGKNAGEMILDGVVEANQHVLIYTPVPILPTRYHVLLSYNPDLIRHGMVSVPGVLQPGHSSEVFLAFKASKKIDLNTLPYIFLLNMVD